MTVPWNHRAAPSELEPGQIVLSPANRSIRRSEWTPVIMTALGWALVLTLIIVGWYYAGCFDK